MKKIFILILCLCMILPVNVSASEGYQLTYNDIGITVYFENSTHFSAEERQYIADQIVYGNAESNDSSTYAFCWLIGHDYQYDYVASVHHRVLDKAPRCEQTNYEVETCSRCDHLEYTPLSTVYIDCCPEE